jgi:hypothetical protein
MDEIILGQNVNIANEYQTPMSLRTWMSKDNMDDSIDQIHSNLPYKCLDSTNVFIKSNEEKSSYVPIWFIIIYVKSQNFVFFHVHVDGEGEGV